MRSARSRRGTAGPPTPPHQLDSTSEPGFLLLHARYEFHGAEHTFIADIQARENTAISPPTATVDGIVTSGWMNGASLTGSFTAYTTCPVPTPGNVRGSLCFQGVVHLEFGGDDD